MNTRKCIDRNECGDFTGETYARIQDHAVKLLYTFYSLYPDIDLHDLQSIISNNSHFIMSHLLVGEFIELNEKRKSDLSCWENDPILLTSHPPKHVWKCRYCGKEVITKVGDMPDGSCECRNTYEKDDEV